MSPALPPLPSDPAALRAFIAALQAENHALKQENGALKNENRHSAVYIEKLKFELAVLRRAHFGRSGEKLDPRIEQLELQIDELETAEKVKAARRDAEAGKRGVSILRPERAQPVRKPLPSTYRARGLSTPRLVSARPAA